MLSQFLHESCSSPADLKHCCLCCFSSTRSQVGPAVDPELSSTMQFPFAIFVLSRTTEQSVASFRSCLRLCRALPQLLHMLYLQLSPSSGALRFFTIKCLGSCVTSTVSNSMFLAIEIYTEVRSNMSFSALFNPGIGTMGFMQEDSMKITGIAYTPTLMPNGHLANQIPMLKERQESTTFDQSHQECLGVSVRITRLAWLHQHCRRRTLCLSWPRVDLT